MRNFICDPRTDDLSVVEEIQRITSLSMEVRNYISGLQKNYHQTKSIPDCWRIWMIPRSLSKQL